MVSSYGYASDRDEQVSKREVLPQSETEGQRSVEKKQNRASSKPQGTGQGANFKGRGGYGRSNNTQ